MRPPALPLAALSLAALAAALLVSAPAALAQEDAPPRTITVQGEGTVTAKPDTASVSAGVMTEAKTARDALTANSEKMSGVMEAIAGAGIAEDDIRTSGFSVSPVYSQPERRPDGSRPNAEIVGYRASNQVVVTVRDLAKVGAVLDEVVTAGANNVNGISFYVDKAESLMDEARKRAVEDALRRASIMATAANANLGQVMTVSEQGGYRPEPMMMRMASVEAGGAMDVPVAPGTQELRAAVNIVIALE